MDGRHEKSFYRLVILILLFLRHTSSSDTDFDEIEAIPATSETKDNSDVATTWQSSSRRSRMYRRGGYQGDQDANYYDDHHDDHDADDDHRNEMKAVSQGKVDYWGGYYDFLINEGSYKFWAVFELGTAALLIYSGFAALYYAKVNPPSTDDDFDLYRRRRRRRSTSTRPRDEPFGGLDSATFQRIIDAIAREFQ